MLFNEPKLLKLSAAGNAQRGRTSFSALQRAEIAEMAIATLRSAGADCCFSALQRAEIAEIVPRARRPLARAGFSALQRAEIAEIENHQN